jgi:hypothetical protein
MKNYIFILKKNWLKFFKRFSVFYRRLKHFLNMNDKPPQITGETLPQNAYFFRCDNDHFILFSQVIQVLVLRKILKCTLNLFHEYYLLFLKLTFCHWTKFIAKFNENITNYKLIYYFLSVGKLCMIYHSLFVIINVTLYSVHNTLLLFEKKNCICYK